MNSREERGKKIADKPDQIHRIDDTHYQVNSQSCDKIYDIISTEMGWTCSCPDHRFRHVCCKHIHAVEISRQIRKAVQKTVTINTVDMSMCKYCDSYEIVKDGKRNLKKGKVQQYKCKACGTRFIHNLGFEGKHATPEQITTAVDLIFSGLSTRKTAAAIRGMNVKVGRQTVLNWATEYGELMDKFVDLIRPEVGEAWRTDEVYLKIRGERKYLFAMIDSETRFWLAKMVASNKGTDDVKPMFRKAKQVAGKVPNTLISDGAANFAEAHHDEYAPKNFLHKDSEHIRHIRMDGDMNNNQMESFNGNTIRLREKVTCGLKKDDSAILTGLQLYHNFVRPHLGLPNEITPAEAAGIHVKGINKWKTLIQAAAKKAKV